jgi:hypothetical protein
MTQEPTTQETKEIAFQVRMPEMAHQALQRHAKALDTSMNAIINAAVVQYLNDSKRQREVLQHFIKAQKDYRLAVKRLKSL